MDIFRVVFDIAYRIMNIDLYLCGFTISLFQVLMYGLIGFILLYIFFRLTR